ncbi:MAG: tRNA (N(6)-L-threonylcarbamoyladenosine(37)-C(2))-methylthiotransferase MtaB [Waddliaceae bacterium]|jgi:threonylcarbamoyladenosine tRNA methylthiotransferase MtaB|nr:tRNA (N(6)-L-threonylcarbamoyladenosine(37)-C(2))-methylthiotransferase MtaB [Waddliaceae bacterium]MBT3578486.1 tRNA (N(6)-L-threonylcarbamoyladenosine(37)-C(2))-methylthiotransferase MtaB [Waddliaceae bacterium]MBT4444934.1 tRNA (N(6)-L-threonylcarbamoyladenosine(37)-C(2))-methylthiotransferase MtaB [Waddliaceae bacterium]MBT6927977.1 tRNA (N(6)-L-threonylcarbamoyladenosine(37)-C(2))-methylthiotransferase MtaB [Waddliaceae bacterium]MBT7263907.1 tRNA (N(6)-L-threonylcarbamoyladenosine(37)-
MRYKTFKITALGCRANQYEAQAMADQLRALGCREAADSEVADVCIVNSCTVTDSADKKSRYLIRRFAKENPGATIVVTGCMAERIPDLAEKVPEVDHVVGNKDKEHLISILFPELEKLPEFTIKSFEGHTRAFVKIQDGCNSFCTYCIIPYVRGRSRSRKVEDIVKEVQRLVDSGYKEVVLTGINIGDYEDGTKTLADLIRAIDGVDGLERLRLSSIDPNDFDDDLYDALMTSRTTCPSLHLVLQSGSNAVLKKMNRKYSRHDYYDVVERFRNGNADFTFTTDIIVGFPGETEKDFQDTIDVVQEVGFVHAHIFPYSDRPGTIASKYEEKISAATIKERKETLSRVANNTAYDIRERYIGKTMQVLIENGSKGHTENFLPAIVNEGKANTMVKVLLVENTQEALIGKI